MIAYNRQSLDNRDIRQQTAEALAKGVLTHEEYSRILETSPVKLYTPNSFIRIGLFLLTVLGVACGVGLLLLIGSFDREHSISIFLIVLGIITYGALEFFIRVRAMYRAGVDDALLWSAAGLLFLGLNWWDFNISSSLESTIVLVLAAWGVLRYADTIMALVGYSALVCLIFYKMIPYGDFASAILPFVIMAVSAVTYLLSTRLAVRESLRPYYYCSSLLRMAALLSFYGSCNYYVIQKVNASLHGEHTAIGLAWLWWTLTIIVPVGYIIAGIRKKDGILLWAGLGLVAPAILTVRYYHPILPAEWAMVLAGAALLVVAYALIRYLNPPKGGFTSNAQDDPHPLRDLPIETLIMAESIKVLPTQPSDQAGHFGGGSGGGGGAGGTY